MKASIGIRRQWLRYNLLIGLIAGILNTGMAQTTKNERSPEATHGSANRGPASNFSGTVWVTTLVGPNPQTDCTVSSVTFEPKARTFWHTHPNGQLLVVTQGVGYYQEKGKPIQVIREGESVTIEREVEHWHGASPTGQFTHIAINPNVSKGGAVNWLRAVTDEEYKTTH